MTEEQNAPPHRPVPPADSGPIAESRGELGAAAPTPQDVEARVVEFQERFQKLRKGVAQAIVGQREVVDATLTAIVVGGHVLLEGVPGLGKTFLVRTLSKVLGVEFNRIQFTPDLMPADILGTNLVMENPEGGKAFKFEPGPIFTSLCLADEINRATPKTQSALLEAMQERSVTTGGAIRPLPRPFFVLATQNPLEMEGTYPLPEAQLDRFFFKINVRYPSLEELIRIVDLTTGAVPPKVERAMDRDTFLSMQDMVGAVPIAEHVTNYAMRLVLATQPATQFSTEKVRKFVSYGSSPRGGQALVLAGKVRALQSGRFNVSFEDIAWAALPALRHRIILNFEGEAEGITTDEIIRDVLQSLPKDAALAASL